MSQCTPIILFILLYLDYMTSFYVIVLFLLGGTEV
jgi:hypothetical protein